uniref:Uncharacterized protein n=1 Tax=Latimeria chalumnae TaxID=7897 RepID=H2ZWU3_LATCH
MSGIYSGLQSSIKHHVKEADYVLCASHSLTLVGISVAECCVEGISYFGFIQSVYVFLSVSTYQWDTLTNCYQQKQLTAKCLSSTRWSACADATRAVRAGYQEIKEALMKLSQDESQKPIARNDAEALSKRFDVLETTLMTVIWDTLLQRFNSKSKSLQNPKINLGVSADLYKSLYEFVQITREHFNQIE